MSIVCCGLSALAVAVLFYTYRDHTERLIRNEMLRSRVTYMLWVMANAARR